MKYEKKCPRCNKIQSYKTQKGLNKAIRKNSVCNECSRIVSWEVRRGTDRGDISRICPYCNSIVVHKNKSDARAAERSNSRCKSCILKYMKTDEYRKKMSKVTSGENNPMYGKSVYDTWVEKYGKDKADKLEKSRRVKHSKAISGKNNPMYGKPAPVGSGNGWGGWYNGHYFRSLRELSMMYWMDLYNIKWVTAETKEYIVDMGESTYRADFVVGNILIEVKPERLKNLTANKDKQEAAIEFCRSKGMRYKIVDPTIINIDIIKCLIDRNIVVFNQKTLKKYQQFLQKS